MQNSGKKITSLAIITLSIACFSISYGEENFAHQERSVPLYSLSETVDNTLLIFMRDNQMLVNLATGAGKIEDISINNEDPENKELTMIQQLPFRTLYHQLANKLEALAKAEKYEESEFVYLHSVSDALSYRSSLDSLLKTNMENVELYSQFMPNYPNTRDHMLLSATLTDAIDKLAKFQEGLTKAENNEFFGLIFDKALANYKKFVEQNKDILDAIEQVANNEFKIKTDQKCKSNKGKEYCISGEQETEFKTLSEIMSYVKKLQGKKITEVSNDKQVVEDLSKASTTKLQKDGSIASNELESVTAEKVIEATKTAIEVVDNELQKTENTRDENSWMCTARMCKIMDFFFAVLTATCEHCPDNIEDYWPSVRFCRNGCN